VERQEPFDGSNILSASLNVALDRLTGMYIYIYICILLCDQNSFDGLLSKVICIYPIYICSNTLSPSLNVALDRLTGEIIDLCIV
jgi:hypothetical protein